MFITDRLIYIQMQKTGCTHIAALLAKLFQGKQVGKHNAASAAQINSDISFVSSIRNPWDWYLSLWTYGVQGEGGVMQRLTTGDHRPESEPSSKNTFHEHAFGLSGTQKEIAPWQNLYDDSRNVQSFRKWLQRIHDPSNAPWLGEGYGESAVTGFCGFMSYRYLLLCCAKPWRLHTPNSVMQYTDLVRFEKKSCYIDFFIRQESLEDDFCKIVQTIRPITEKEKEEIYGTKRTNISARPLPISEYYDEDSIDMIWKRDRLLIEKFGYAPPFRPT